MEMIEPTDPYERGFIDGMAKQRDSAVQRFVEGGTPDSELAEHKRIIREQQAEIEALHNLVKEQDMKIINLSFDVAYANRKDEWLNETDKQVIDEERGNKALRNNEIGKILTKVLDDCGLLKKASEK